MDGAKREYTNEEQLDRFADFLEPIVEIVNDPDFKAASKISPAKGITAAIRKNKAAVIKLLAVADGIPPEEYHVPNPVALLAKAVQLITKPEMSALFPSLAQTDGDASSGPLTESTGDGAQ